MCPRPRSVTNWRSLTSGYIEEVQKFSKCPIQKQEYFFLFVYCITHDSLMSIPVGCHTPKLRENGINNEGKFRNLQNTQMWSPTFNNCQSICSFLK